MINTSQNISFFRFPKNCAGSSTRITIQEDAKDGSEGYGEFYILSSSYTRHDSLHLHWPVYSISPVVSISIFILLIKQLFSKILSPKFHARASKEIRSRRTYKSLNNIQTSRKKEGMGAAFAKAARRSIFAYINTGEGINPYGKAFAEGQHLSCFLDRKSREKQWGEKMKKSLVFINPVHSKHSRERFIPRV